MPAGEPREDAHAARAGLEALPLGGRGPRRTATRHRAPSRHIDNLAAAVRLLDLPAHAYMGMACDDATGGWASRWRMHEHLSYVSASYRYVLPIAMCILSAYNRYGKKVLATVEQRHPSNAPAANRKPIISASVGIASMKKQQICN